jgi:hypothetical protein
MEWESRILESLIRSWRGTGLKTGWFVEIAQFKQIFRPEDGLPASKFNLCSNLIE